MPHIQWDGTLFHGFLDRRMSWIYLKLTVVDSITVYTCISCLSLSLT